MTDVQQLALHFRLSPGKHADAEIIAKTILALASYAQEVAGRTDPTTAIRIEIVGNDEGSLIIRYLIKVLPTTKKGIGIGVVLAVISWFKQELPEILVGLGIDQFIEYIMGKDSDVDNTDFKAIAEHLVKLLQDETLKAEMRKFFIELTRDDAISGVGVSGNHDHLPAHMLSRGDIERRAQITPTEPEVPLSRQRFIGEADVLIVMPALIAQPKKWKLQGPDGLQWYTMADVDFLSRMADGKRNLTFQANIQLNVDLIFIENFVDGVWKVQERRVEKVHGGRPIAQNTLNL